MNDRLQNDHADRAGPDSRSRPSIPATASSAIWSPPREARLLAHFFPPLLVGLLTAATLNGFAANHSDFFEQRVAPILERHCLKCHSHATGKMKGGLTLDSRSGWATGGDSGPAVVPGQPDISLLIKAVRHTDPDLQMPPKTRLTDGEIVLLEEWVRFGAPDPRTNKIARTEPTDWWSLRRLVAPQVPGKGHPIDAFIRRRLAEMKLKPAGIADRVTLLRRLSVDLHGLLPTPEEVAAFVEDEHPDAFERTVDALLASPRYGERWARHWLDTIHFADSHGCEHDVKRPHAWRYRDYVIDRLNADVPWDRFIREQLAADALFPDEPQLIPALGFIAAGPLELSRAGTAPITFDYLDRDDMVTQTMAAFASTTANCARCHTHKFDPITQEDYYSLQAVFAGIGKGDVEYDTKPKTARRRDELEALLQATMKGDASILLRPQYAAIVRAWETAYQAEPAAWIPLKPETFLSAGGATLTMESDGSIFASGHAPDEEHYTVTAPLGLNRLTAVRLDTYHDERLPMNGPGRAANGNFHLAEVDLRWFPAGSKNPVQLVIAKASADFDQSGWTSAQAIDGDRKTGWAIFPRTNESHHIVFTLKTPLKLTPGGRLAVSLHQQYPPKHLIGRFRLSVTDASPEKAVALPEPVRKALQKPEKERHREERIAVAALALGMHARNELEQLPAKSVAYAASAWWSHAKKQPQPIAPKPVHVLKRGDFFKPGPEAHPGALTAITALPGRFNLPPDAPESARRVALANWLSHPDNPLTWRSIVNRVWLHHFGRGLCDTPNDFGRMGGEPSHPELLDWLAVWFRDEAKGSLKELHRLILTSHTWRQSTAVAGSGRDAGNRLLWRMNRRRQDAETFRDSALRMSGRLDLSMGGPGVEQFAKTKGPQATPQLDYAAFDWSASEAARRSIYRVVWRGIADPFMESLDFPDLGLLPAQRAFSVSALQSLTLYNNDFVLQIADDLARRLTNEHPRLDDRVSRAVQLTWLRLPSHVERNDLIAHAERHGLPALCRVLLNSNEFLFVE